VYSRECHKLFSVMLCDCYALDKLNHRKCRAFVYGIILFFLGLLEIKNHIIGSDSQLIHWVVGPVKISPIKRALYLLSKVTK